jgi:hypothetical protein
LPIAQHVDLRPEQLKLMLRPRNVLVPEVLIRL